MLEWLAAGALVKAGAVIAAWSRLRSPHALARTGYLSKLRRLLEKSPGLANARDRGNETPLMHAARCGQEGAASLLLAWGADPNASCARGGTAIMMAAELGHASLVRTLLDAGARVNERDAEQATALHLAAVTGRVETIQCLLRAGADAAAKDAHGRTAFEIAVEQGHRSAAEELRERPVPPLASRLRLP